MYLQTSSRCFGWIKRLDGHQCNNLFVVTAGYGFDHLGDHIALAMPAAPSSLFIKYMYSSLVLCLCLPSRESRDDTINFKATYQL